MTVTTGISFVLASISSVLVFSGMQMYKPWLSSSQFHTLLGGYLGSIFFILSLTAYFSVYFWLYLLLLWFIDLLISLCALFYVNKYSQKVHIVQAPPVPVQTGKKKKNVS
ncbi:KRTCAP2 -like protein [Asbolus verrucosus]|uniref:KRTCAP2-like protein n=1 Tax=Asbolus verrucosus TaxID=1661398 RepID=A0A482W6E5_ASBVE|nr:KRTCAP2 -like protein [Asbolus verrucosus]